MPAPVRPSSSPAGLVEQWPWLIVAAAGLMALADSTLWLSWHIIAALSGHGWSGPGWSIALIVLVATRGTTAFTPSVPAAPLWVLTVVLTVSTIAAIAAPAVVLIRRLLPSRDPARSMATRRDLHDLTPTALTAKAIRLRPGLPTVRGEDLPAAQCGITLGRLKPSGPDLAASWEDVLLAVMAPRSGKTTSLAVPTILNAPGWAVATSNKADLWTTTAQLRAATGTVWTFDPQGIVHAEQTWWWNPISIVRNIATAHRLASHFIQEIRSERGDKDFWSSAAQDLLTSLLLAAARADLDITAVDAWLNDTSNPEPVAILDDAQDHSAAASLRGRQQGAPDTREGIYETARTAVQCLRDDTIMRWVTPQRGIDTTFDVDAFVTSTDTVYLLSKDGAGAAAPLVAALTDAIMRAAVQEAERAGGRLDPPGVIVLDEAANVCRIADLPDLYSHLGSRGIIPLTVLQSYTQGKRVWGEIGMDTLWSAATIKVIGAGIDDARVAEDLSRLIGEEDVDVRSTSWGDGRYSRQASTRRQRILDAADVRALPRSTAILLSTGARAALISLLPWYTGPHRDAITAATTTAEAELTRRARTAHPRTGRPR